MASENTLNSWQVINLVPGFPLSRQEQRQAICRTNAHLLIQILRKHHATKIKYSTNKVQVSYSVELPQSNFPDYTNSDLFPDFQLFFLTFA